VAERVKELPQKVRSIPLGQPIRDHLIQFFLPVIIQILLNVEHDIKTPVDPLGPLPKESLEKISYLLDFCRLLCLPSLVFRMASFLSIGPSCRRRLKTLLRSSR
jgi:hypothetical protein